jgi:hypothetical protein
LLSGDGEPGTFSRGVVDGDIRLHQPAGVDHADHEPQQEWQRQRQLEGSRAQITAGQ